MKEEVVPLVQKCFFSKMVIAIPSSVLLLPPPPLPFAGVVLFLWSSKRALCFLEKVILLGQYLILQS